LTQRIAYVGLGSNIGNKIAHCVRAVRELSSVDISIQRVSSLYKTEPVGYADQDWFVNAVAEVCLEVSAHGLLKRLRAIEKTMGRASGLRWGPRVIDLDILLCGDDVVDEEDLVIPHPRLQERRFVLVPLAELVPELVHPVLNKTISDLLADVGSDHYVERCGSIPMDDVREQLGTL